MLSPPLIHTSLLAFVEIIINIKSYTMKNTIAIADKVINWITNPRPFAKPARVNEVQDVLAEFCNSASFWWLSESPGYLAVLRMIAKSAKVQGGRIHDALNCRILFASRRQWTLDSWSRFFHVSETQNSEPIGKIMTRFCFSCFSRGFVCETVGSTLTSGQIPFPNLSLQNGNWCEAAAGLWMAFSRSGNSRWNRFRSVQNGANWRQLARNYTSGLIQTEKGPRWIFPPCRPEIDAY